jgi:hypothetical protein
VRRFLELMVQEGCYLRHLQLSAGIRACRTIPSLRYSLAPDAKDKDYPG